jgi:UDPglucose 6-dehydrogenase
MKIAVIGAGYVGLVSAAGFAEFGNSVVCIDKDQTKIDQLQKCISPIFEPGLEDILKSNIKKGKLRFSSDINEVKNYGIIFIAVGTPQSADGSADLSALFSVAITLKSIFKENDYPSRVLVIKSTVPVGTADKIRDIITPRLACVISNPEFLREGAAVSDFMRPDRVIIGCNDDKFVHIMEKLYEPVSNVTHIFITDSRTAELTKYASNAMLASRISFMNEIAELSENVGADIDMVRRGIGADNRIGSKYLYPGPGFGGSCFPKDLNALRFVAGQNSVSHKMVDAILEVNENQKHALFGKILTVLNSSFANKVICIWGLSFKAMTDDIRDSPAISLIDDLINYNKVYYGFKEIRVHDPKALNNTKNKYEGKLKYYEDMYEAANSADVLILTTEWREYRSPDFDLLKRNSSKMILIDGRNIWHGKDVAEAGLRYCCIGQKFIG